MEKTANQGGEQHKYTWGFFGYQPGSTESAAPVPIGKQAGKGESQEGEGQKGMKNFSVSWRSGRQVPASSRPSDNEQGRPTSRTRKCSFTSKKNPQKQPHVLPDMPASLCCHSVSWAQGEEELMMCFLSTLWAGIMRHYKKNQENTAVTTVPQWRGRGQGVQAAHSVAKMATEFERVSSLNLTHSGQT